MIPFTTKKTSIHHKTLSQVKLAETGATDYPFSPVSPFSFPGDNNQQQGLGESPPRPGKVQSAGSLMKLDELRTLETTRRGLLPSRFTFIEHYGLRILMTDAPKDDELGSYSDLLQKYNVKTLVRVCEPTYDPRMLQSRMDNGFQFFDMPFPDGSVPPNNVVQDWLNVVDRHFPKHSPSKNPQADDQAVAGVAPVIAVHCMAGLGRAPLMVAIALVERGMEPIDSVGFIRARRRGAINSRQLLYLEEYQARKAHAQALKGNADSKRPGFFPAKLKGSKNNLISLGSLGRKSRSPSPKNQHQ